jgi:hypothetical protein
MSNYHDGNELQLNVCEEDYLEYEEIKRNESLKKIAKRFLANNIVDRTDERDEKELIRLIQTVKSLQDAEIDLEQLFRLVKGRP